MAASAKKSDEQYVQPAQVEEARHRPTAASALDAATPSPARMLQEALGVELPAQYLSMLPYVATIVVLLALMSVAGSLVSPGRGVSVATAPVGGV